MFRDRGNWPSEPKNECDLAGNGVDPRVLAEAQPNTELPDVRWNRAGEVSSGVDS